jgi:hypothetical protein
MVNIAPDFPIEDSSREPRGIEQGLLSPVFLTRSFPPSTRAPGLEPKGPRLGDQGNLK